MANYRFGLQQHSDHCSENSDGSAVASLMADRSGMNGIALIPIDPRAVRDVGVLNWQRGIIWPIPDSSFHPFCKAVYDSFGEVISASDEVVGDLLLADHHFVIWFTQRAHAVAVMQWCNDRGASIASNGTADVYYRPDFQALSEFYKVLRNPKGYSSNRIRSGIKQLYWNGPRDLILACSDLNKCPVLSLGSRSWLRDEYVSRNRLVHRYSSWQEMFGRTQRENISPPTVQQRAVTEACRVLCDAAKRHLNVSIRPESLEGPWLCRLKDLGRLYAACASFKGKVERLLLTDVSNSFHKAVALGLRRNGTRVTLFHHGNEVGAVLQWPSPYVEFAHGDEFVSPGFRCARAFEKSYNRSTIAVRHPVQFAAVGSNHYEKLGRKLVAQPRRSRTQTVMLPGFPMHSFRHPTNFPGLHFSFQLDLERRIARCLRAGGYRVIYKVHPEQLEAAKGLFDGAVDEIETEHFEKVWMHADAFVFGQSSSTIFQYALLTDRPVTVIDAEGSDWNEEVLPLIRRRCNFVRASFDCDNRLNFSDQELLAKIGNITASVVNEYRDEAFR